jgi:hypothetical protein
MIAPKAQLSAKPNGAGSKKTSAKLTMMPDAVPSQEKIRTRAYQLYESRGGEPGQEERDWLRAEQEILNRNR